MKFVASVLLMVAGLGLLSADAYWHLGMPRELAMASGGLMGAGIILLFQSTAKKQAKKVSRPGLAIFIEDLPDGVYEAVMPINICPGESHGAVVAPADRRVESPEDIRLVYSGQRIPRRFELGAPAKRRLFPLPEPIPVGEQAASLDETV